jgi:hypothetical protein
MTTCITATVILDRGTNPGRGGRKPAIDCLIYGIIKNSVFWDVMPCGFVKTDVSEELGASFIRVTRISELGTTYIGC